MANYANLLATIAANIYTNNNNEVTAAMVKAAVDQMVASLGADYQFAGVATPATNPGTPDQKVFYLAATAGTYTDFGGIVLSAGEVAVIKGSGSSWTKEDTGAITADAVNLPYFTDGYYINKSDGTLAAHYLFCVSNFIKIDKYNRYILSIQVSGGAVGACAFYSADKTFISAINAGYYSNLKISIPYNAVYMRFCSEISTIGNFSLVKELNVANNVEDNKESIPSSYTVKNVVDKSVGVIVDKNYGFISGKYLKLSDGTDAATNVNYQISPYIRVIKDEYSYYLSLNMTQSIVSPCVFYDKDMNPLLMMPPKVYDKQLLYIPKDAYYLRLCVNFNDFVQVSDIILQKIENKKNTIPYLLYDAIKNQTYISQDGWTLSGDKFICNTAGINNRLQINRRIAATGRKFIIDFKKANGVLYFMMYSTSADKRTLLSVDFSQGTFNLHHFVNSNPISVSSIIESSSFTPAGDDYYRLVVSSNNRGEIKSELFGLTYGNSLSTLEKDYQFAIPDWGLLQDFPSIFCSVSGFEVSRFQILAEQSHNNLIQVVGDSITQGYYSTIPEMSYVGLLCNKLGRDNVVWSGRSGGGVAEIKEIIIAETSSLKPKYVMVMVGTNGGITKQDVTDILNLVRERNCIPIICHIPSIQGSSYTLLETNAFIDEALGEYQYEKYCVRMDAATSLSHDPQYGKNTSLFYDSLHPNDLGHLNMFRQIIIDMPELLL